MCSGEHSYCYDNGKPERYGNQIVSLHNRTPQGSHDDTPFLQVVQSPSDTVQRSALVMQHVILTSTTSQWRMMRAVLDRPKRNVGGITRAWGILGAPNPFWLLSERVRRGQRTAASLHICVFEGLDVRLASHVCANAHPVLSEGFRWVYMGPS
ncbi:hypothetical protein BD413DRAFT_292906 [Trametes elegans]|nr:hypothetical protein BD413DRAFT_292906 [Trametes elegans]